MVDNPSAAEDLLQDTYLRVTRALTQRSVEYLEPFVFQTARNLALDHLRARKARGRTLVEAVGEDVVNNVVEPASSPEQAAHAERTLRQLSARLGRLSVRQQRIFVLSRLQGCSYLDIAKQLHVSASTVQKELKLIMAVCTQLTDLRP